MAGGAPEPEDFRTFIRETTRRHELATNEMIRRSQEHRMDFVDEMRAQRAALFAVIDRLEGSGPATSG